jgi:hypothetical protein
MVSIARSTLLLLTAKDRKSNRITGRVTAQGGYGTLARAPG